MHLFVSCVVLIGSLFLKCHQEFMLLYTMYIFILVQLLYPSVFYSLEILKLLDFY